MTTARPHYSTGSDTVSFVRQTWAGLRVLLVLTVLLGLVYPLAVTGRLAAAVPVAGERLAGLGVRRARDRPRTTPSARCWSARPSRVRSGSTRARPRPATGTTPWRPPGRTSDRSTPTCSRPSRSAGPRWPTRRASTRPPSPSTRSPRRRPGLDPDISPAYARAAGRPGRPGAGPVRRRRPHARGRHHRGPRPRCARRAAGERPAPQPRPGRPGLTCWSCRRRINGSCAGRPAWRRRRRGRGCRRTRRARPRCRCRPAARRTGPGSC